MSVFGIVSGILLILVLLAIAGLFKSSNLKGIEFNTVPGALVGVVVLMRYLTYTAVAAPVVAISNYIMDSNPDSGIISVPFRVIFDNAVIDISGMGTSEIRGLVGNLEVGQPDAVTLSVYVLFVLGLIALIHFITVKAQRVFTTLYHRKPFDEHNATLIKQIAILSFSIWALSVMFKFFMTAYLQSHLTIEGARLFFSGFNVIGPFFLFGIIFVLSEVFRVGYELKQENELTV